MKRILLGAVVSCLVSSVVFGLLYLQARSSVVASGPQSKPFKDLMVEIARENDIPSEVIDQLLEVLQKTAKAKGIGLDVQQPITAGSPLHTGIRGFVQENSVYIKDQQTRPWVAHWIAYCYLNSIQYVEGESANLQVYRDIVREIEAPIWSAYEAKLKQRSLKVGTIEKAKRIVGEMITRTERRIEELQKDPLIPWYKRRLDVGKKKDVAQKLIAGLLKSMPLYGESDAAIKLNPMLTKDEAFIEALELCVPSKVSVMLFDLSADLESDRFANTPYWGRVHYRCQGSRGYLPAIVRIFPYSKDKVDK